VFEKQAHRKITLESECRAGGMARVRFYTMPVRGSRRPLKIDFVEDVLFTAPGIKTFKGVRVYDAEAIYMQKICAITGTVLKLDEIGREVIQGRNEGRDAFDIYMLSKKIMLLHLYLKKIPSPQQRGMIHWYRTFSRQDLKLSLLDLDIYDKNFDAKDMIVYLEGEIRKFTNEAIG